MKTLHKTKLPLKLRWMMWRSRFSLPVMLSRYDEAPVVAVAAGLNGGLTLLVMSLLAWICNLPLIFPALAPTAFVLTTAPLSPPAAPRSVILGHLTGFVCGYGAWNVTRLLGSETAAAADLVTLLSAAATLACTGFLLVRFACPHPAACGSALIICLGGIAGWLGFACMMGAVVLMTYQTMLLHRLMCLPVPAWAPRET